MVRTFVNPLWWQRLRHRRGFGIHSPFAFRFITEVLNPPRGYRYYAEENVRSSDERLLARMKGFFGINSVVYAKDSAASDYARAGIIVADLGSVDSAPLIERIREGNVVVLALNHSERTLRPLLEAMPSGMSFRNFRSKAVLVVRKKLPRQDFAVWF